jgi:hypothetical protein
MDGEKARIDDGTGKRYAIGKPDQVRAPALPLPRGARRPVLQHGLCIVEATANRAVSLRSSRLRCA